MSKHATAIAVWCVSPSGGLQIPKGSQSAGNRSFSVQTTQRICKYYCQCWPLKRNVVFEVIAELCTIWIFTELYNAHNVILNSVRLRRIVIHCKGRMTCWPLTAIHTVCSMDASMMVHVVGCEHRAIFYIALWLWTFVRHAYSPHVTLGLYDESLSPHTHS